MLLPGSRRVWRSREGLIRLVQGHLVRHPAAEPRDIYKLLYQGVLGLEHLIDSEAEFAARLRDELARVAADEQEPPWEPVRPDGLLGRLNLRPFKARGGDPDLLLEVCLRTASQRWGTLEELERVWTAFAELVDEGLWPSLSSRSVDSLSHYLAQRDYPPLHHSTMFRRSYAPAYRVIAARWTGMLRVLGLPEM